METKKWLIYSGITTIFCLRVAVSFRKDMESMMVKMGNREIKGKTM